MPTIQVRDVPQDVYDALVESARLERRSLAQQVVVTLERGLHPGVDNRARRHALLERMRQRGPISTKYDYVSAIREDRNR
jgi:hypothetical protein